MKRRLTMLLLAVCMVVGVSGCEMVDLDRNKDMAQVVATFAGKEMTKGELYEILDSYFIANYGFSATDENLTTEQRAYVDTQAETFLDAMVDVELVGIICDETMPLNEEETKSAQEELES
ncbi:hypothetical protein LJC55_02605, partial [Eubacteriales bacterium OttesenSCG-928-N14]|nr:hypothetical protein [Eubacteriales bacterium OttesenSCG-928-N14]